MVKTKQWKIKEQGDPRSVQQLADAINVDQCIANILVQRGIETYEDAKHFFRPQLHALSDPFLMKGMQRAVERLHQAVHNRENILIYGDYDVDGTTAVALMMSCLKVFTDRIDYYIPDRYEEGYGISLRGIDYAHEAGVTLLIALDCGIKALDQIRYANSKHIDVIICDHHLPANGLPEAFAILNPKQQDCAYPFKELTGCAIGYKLAQAYFQYVDRDFDLFDQLIQLVAISTACDIVPMIGENRILTYYGLQKINAKPLPAVQAMLASNEKIRFVDVSRLVFYIGPRLNAAGRMAHASKAVELLMADTEEKAKRAVALIEQYNADRKMIDTKTLDEAVALIEEDHSLHDAKTSVLYKDGWHQGVLGIVASRIQDYYYRPTVMLTGINGYAVGSARSVRDFDLYSPIEACRELLYKYGGHRYAAGLMLKMENLHKFRKKFEAEVSKRIEEDMLIPKLSIDMELDFNRITPKFMHIIKQFAPFGPGNMRVVFLTRNVINTGYSRTVGQDNEHLKLHVLQKGGSVKMNGIAFHMGDKLELINNHVCDMVYVLEERVWKGEKSVQLKVKDIRPARQNGSL